MGVCRGCGEETYVTMIHCACPSDEEIESTMSDEWFQAVHDANYDHQPTQEK